MIKAFYRKKVLHFNYPARTSRGVLINKPAWFVFLYRSQIPEITGIGECSIIPGLSRETEDQAAYELDSVCRRINQGEFSFKDGLSDLPSVRFGLETAKLDLDGSGLRILYPSAFTRGETCIHINGLIWMGDTRFMEEQIEEKLNQHFTCLKLKIGDLNLEDELAILRSLRQRFRAGVLEIRLDANGAFDPEKAPEILKRLSDLQIHSVEQPIKAGNWDAMAAICKSSPVPVALDEELLNRPGFSEKQSLLEHINPQYLVLKPGLLGGFQQAGEYIKLAEMTGTGWWITSSLESNIGLNAISQWTFMQGNPMPQGLGTGKLFRQNIESPLVLEGDKLFYLPERGWDLKFIQ
jgi:o-succinylbenzoate synthase